MHCRLLSMHGCRSHLRASCTSGTAHHPRVQRTQVEIELISLKMLTNGRLYATRCMQYLLRLCRRIEAVALNAKDNEIWRLLRGSVYTDGVHRAQRNRLRVLL